METKETLKEYIRLLEKKPDVAEMLLTDLVRCYDLRNEEQMELVKLWSKNPCVAKRLLSTYSEHKLICDEVLIELVKLLLNGSTSAGNFLQKYDEQKGLRDKVQMFLIDLWQNGSNEAGDFLLKRRKQHDFCADAQVKFVGLFPNSIAIMLMKGQRSYSKKALLKLLDIWMQYPDEVSSILLKENCLEEIFENGDVLLRILEFIETKPNDVKKIMHAYLQYKNLCYTNFMEIQEKVLEYVEKGSENVSFLAGEFMVLFAKRVATYGEDLCKKIMELFKENPEKMYDILLSIVQNSHWDTVDAELIAIWQKGEKGSIEAYKLLLAAKDIGKDNNAKLFNLWRKGVSGAYEILKAQDIQLFLNDENQIELANLVEEDSKEAYTLLFNHTYYPGHKLCPEALMILAQSPKPEADTILKRTLRQN